MVARWIGVFGVVGLLGLSIGGCSSESTPAGGAACNTDLDCDRGTVCRDGLCGVVECVSFSDCGDGQLCVDDPTGNSSTGKVCTGIECGVGQPCPAGGECLNGLCSGGNVGTDGSDGTDPGGCTSDADCPDGQSCDTVLGSCTSTEPLPTGSCAPCGEGSPCESGLTCAKIGVSEHCTTSCAVKGDCFSGWECYEGNCVPGLFQCADCLLTGCTDDPAKPYCDPSTGECSVAKSTCEECLKGDAQCGPGKRCHARDSETKKACVPECGTDADCPENGQCKDIGDGIKLCEWKTQGECCLGAACTGSPAGCDDLNCSGATPHCVAGACVQCLNDSHCSGETPKCQSSVCVAGEAQCTGNTPHWNAAKDKCCECLNDSNCGASSKCTADCSCKVAGGGVCDECEDPYPGCANYQEQWVCVQCSDDSHCGGNECDLTTYTCVGLPPTTSDCTKDGCFNPGDVCDEASGLCLDPSGNCDNVTQFCPGGAPCISQLELLLSCFPGGAGGIPAIPGAGGGAGGGIPGQCECTLSAGEIPGFAQGSCQSGFTCGPHPLSIILSLLSMTGCMPPNVCNPG